MRVVPWFKKHIFYVLLYAAGVTLLTLCLERLPVFLQMENAIYDPLQRMFAIDRPDDKRYSKFHQELSDILAIHLDTSFFYRETARVRRDRLAELLQVLAEQPQLKVIFLDYLFTATDASAPADSLLAESMKALGDRLVLPYEIDFEPVPIWGGLSPEAVKVEENLLLEPTHKGYLAFLTLVGDDTYRYHQVRLDGGSRQSVVLALVDADPARPPGLNSRPLPNTFEINYVLRNDPPFQALTIYDASAIVRAIPAEANGRIAFVGSFESHADIYGRPFDEFATPVSGALPGIYLVLNAYLNVRSGTFFQRANGLLVFVLNGLLAAAGLFYFQRVGSLPVKPVWLMIGEIIGCLVLFAAGLLALYYFFNLKLPFVLTLLAFVRNQYFARLWKEKTHNAIPI